MPDATFLEKARSAGGNLMSNIGFTSRTELAIAAARSGITVVGIE